MWTLPPIFYRTSPCWSAGSEKQLRVLLPSFTQTCTASIFCGGDGGTLAGLLDFGDAFVGCAAWDFALLHWYYSAPDVGLVAGAYPGGAQLSDSGRLLAVAVGLYKFAKDPTQGDLAARIRRRIKALQNKRR